MCYMHLINERACEHNLDHFTEIIVFYDLINY